MKKLLVILVFAALSGATTLMAQLTDLTPRTAEGNARMLTQIMNNYLDLNEKQFDQIEAITLDYNQQSQAILEQKVLTKEQLSIFQNLQRTQEKQIAKHLTIEQKNRYRKHFSDIRNEFRQYVSGHENVAKKD